MVEDDDLFEFGEEEEDEDQNEEEDENSSLNNDILFMENIMDLDLIGFDENGDEDENSTRNVQEAFDHGDRIVDFDAIFAEEFLEKFLFNINVNK